MYKLINAKTNEEYLCDKVTIDGFDYYVSAKYNDLGGWHIDVEFKLLSNPSRYNVVDEMREVIATNNPNMDIPKVVDEVEKLSLQSNEFWRYGGDYDVFEIGFKAGYNKSQETHPFSEEDVVEFGDWIRNNPYVWNYPDKLKDRRTTKELLRLWKEQQPKIVYYED